MISDSISLVYTLSKLVCMHACRICTISNRVFYLLECVKLILQLCWHFYAPLSICNSEVGRSAFKNLTFESTVWCYLITMCNLLVTTYKDSFFLLTSPSPFPGRSAMVSTTFAGTQTWRKLKDGLKQREHSGLEWFTSSWFTALSYV